MDNQLEEEADLNRDQRVADVDGNQTRRRLRNSLNRDFLLLLECPVCMAEMISPIHQCTNGHLLCAPCRGQLDTCPSCRIALTDIRSLAMEKVSEMIQHPCKNGNCPETFLLSDRKKHDAVCTHRQRKCVSPLCIPVWTGKLDDLIVHYQTTHKDMFRRGPQHTFIVSTTNDDMEEEDKVSNVWAIYVHKNLFLFHFCITLRPTKKVHGCVQLIGPHKMSKEFIYKVKVPLPLDEHRSVKVERTTHNEGEEIVKIYAEEDCFQFSNSLIDIFERNFDHFDFLEVSISIRQS